MLGGSFPRRVGLQHLVSERHAASGAAAHGLGAAAEGLADDPAQDAGALPPARDPTLKMRWVPRSGCLERRGTKTARTARTIQTAIVPTTSMKGSADRGAFAACPGHTRRSGRSRSGRTAPLTHGRHRRRVRPELGRVPRPSSTNANGSSNTARKGFRWCRWCEAHPASTGRTCRP